MGIKRLHRVLIKTRLKEKKKEKVASLTQFLQTAWKARAAQGFDQTFSAAESS